MRKFISAAVDNVGVFKKGLDMEYERKTQGFALNCFEKSNMYFILSVIKRFQ